MALRTENPPPGLAKYVPILGWRPGYEKAWLRFDLLAGLADVGVLTLAGGH